MKKNKKMLQKFGKNAETLEKVYIRGYNIKEAEL